MAKVAFIGLGVMGYPMAGHLQAKGGHELTVYNRTARQGRRWVAKFGGKAAATPAEAAEGAGLRHVLRRQRRRPARGRRSAPTAPSPAWRRARSSSTTPPPRPTIARELHAAAKAARLRLHRRAGLGRPGRRGERRADGDVRRRCGALCPRRAGDRAPMPRMSSCSARPARASSPRWSTRSASPASCRASPRASTSRRRPGSTSTP